MSARATIIVYLLSKPLSTYRSLHKLHPNLPCDLPLKHRAGFLPIFSLERWQRCSTRYVLIAIAAGISVRARARVCVCACVGSECIG